MKMVEFLAVDTGYSAIKAAWHDENGMKTVKIPSAIAEFPQTGSESGIGESRFLTYRGRSYLVGEDALLFQKRLLSTYSSSFSVFYTPVFLYYLYKKHSIMPQIICLSVALTEYNKDIHCIDVFTGKPLKGKKNELLQRFCKEFEVSGEKIKHEKVAILPQGIGIWFDAGSPQDCIIIDIGDRTIDVVSVVNGKILKEPFSIGYNDAGTKIITADLVQTIRDKFQIEISEVKAKEILRTGKFKHKGKEIEVSEIIEMLKLPYASKVLQMVLSSSDIMSLYEEHGNLIIAGGGAYYFPASVVKEYGIYIPEQPEFANVRGFLKHLTGGDK